MDFWAQRCLEEVAEAAQQGVPPPGHVTDHAMADTVMDFLFASQDASTASLVWTMCLMADHPNILQKVIPCRQWVAFCASAMQVVSCAGG
jgi:sterol 22-desaturase